jgi:hypothetical protein
MAPPVLVSVSGKIADTNRKTNKIVGIWGFTQECMGKKKPVNTGFDGLFRTTQD